MYTFVSIASYSTNTYCFICSNKTFLFILIVSCFIIPKNLMTIDAQFTDDNKVACTGNHRCRGIKRHNNFRRSFVYIFQLFHLSTKQYCQPNKKISISSSVKFESGFGACLVRAIDYLPRLTAMVLMLAVNEDSEDDNLNRRF